MVFIGLWFLRAHFSLLVVRMFSSYRYLYTLIDIFWYIFSTIFFTRMTTHLLLYFTRYVLQYIPMCQFYGLYCLHEMSRNDYRQAYKMRMNDVIKWKKIPRYWPFVRGKHRSLVDSPHKDQWRGAFFVWVEQTIEMPGDLRRHRTHYDVIVMD